MLLYFHRFVTQVIGIGKKNHFEIGQRESLSPIDMAQLRDMYQCNKKVDPQHDCTFLVFVVFYQCAVLVYSCTQQRQNSEIFYTCTHKDMFSKKESIVVSFSLQVRLHVFQWKRVRHSIERWLVRTPLLPLGNLISFTPLCLWLSDETL